MKIGLSEHLNTENGDFLSLSSTLFSEQQLDIHTNLLHFFPHSWCIKYGQNTIVRRVAET